MRYLSCLLMAALLTTSVALVARADNVTDLMENSKKNYEQKRYFKAIEDLEWAIKELNNLHFQKLKTYLPSEVAGYTLSDSGGDVIGIRGLDRTYNQEGTGKSVSINLVSGSAASGGGLGAFMSMASMATGMNPNSQMAMVKGRKGTLLVEPENESATLIFSLPNNVVITLESSGFTTGDEAKKFAELIDFDGLEKEFQ